VVDIGCCRFINLNPALLWLAWLVLVIGVNPLNAMRIMA